jgi:hypothetical protein
VKSLAIYEDVFNHESNELNEWEAIGIEDGSAAATACHLKGLIGKLGENALTFSSGVLKS